MENFQQIWSKAQEAAQAAAAAAQVRPMVVSYGVPGQPMQQEFVEDGVCGFAWVNFPGNTAFGKWAKKSGLARSGYPSGLCHWVSAYGQSMQRKEAHAKAMAAVLQEAGIKAYADSRMD